MYNPNEITSAQIEVANRQAEAIAAKRRETLKKSAEARIENAKRYIVAPINGSQPEPQPPHRERLTFNVMVQFSRPIDGSRHEVHTMTGVVEGFSMEELMENLFKQHQQGLIAFPQDDKEVSFFVKLGKIVNRPRLKA